MTVGAEHWKDNGIREIAQDYFARGSTLSVRVCIEKFLHIYPILGDDGLVSFPPGDEATHRVEPVDALYGLADLPANVTLGQSIFMSRVATGITRELISQGENNG